MPLVNYQYKMMGYIVLALFLLLPYNNFRKLQILSRSLLVSTITNKC